MTRSSIRRSVLALSFAGAAALVAAGCGQEFPAPPAASQQVRPTSRTAALTQAEVCNDPTNCLPTGAHGSLAPGYTGPGLHAGFDCKVCHYVGGRLAFQPGGPAFIPGGPSPTFDATTKTCSNIACHAVAPGTYSYYYPGNDDNDGDGYPDAELKTVTYGGGAAQTTPSWYATGAGCSACHGNPPYPPLPASSGSNAWHSGNHANNTFAGSNACELCHNLPSNVNSPIANSAGGVGVSITTPGMTVHANGSATVNARFRTACFGCH